jgi:uncharacterized RDD family membrane protein YckC
MDWYYSDGRQQLGPVTQAQLDSLVAEGRLNSEHLVWHAGLPAWTPLSALQGRQGATATADPGAAIATEVAQPVHFCSQCGTAHDPNDLLVIGSGVVCANCKDIWLQKLREGVLPGGLSQPGRNFGGFWIRVGAALTDGIVLWIVGLLVNLPITMALTRSITPGQPPALGRMFGLFWGSFFLNTVLAALYEAAFVVYKGGTPGKLALSMRVIREDGTRPGWGLAIGRYFAKLVSYFTMFIGFIMVGLDDEKRGLHDRICGTRVVRV